MFSRESISVCVKKSRPNKNRIMFRCDGASARHLRRVKAKRRPAWSPATGCPDQGQPLARNDLTGRHFRSHRVAEPEIKIPLAPGGGMRGGEVEPFIGQHEVLRHAMALVVDQAKPALSEGIALDCRLLVEIRRGIIGLRHAKAVL